MENEDDPQAKKEELLTSINDAKKQVTEFVESGRKIVEHGQYAAEVADRTKDVIQNTPAHSITDVDRQTEHWKRVVHQLDDVNRTLSPFVTSGPLLGTAMTSATSFAVNSALYANEISPNVNLVRSVNRLNAVLKKPDWPDRAKSEMHRLGLDVRPFGQRSAYDMLQEAHQTLLIPPTGDVVIEGVLLTTREAILAAIDQLLKRRPHSGQEETRGDIEKIISIGTHCGKSGISQIQFNDLGDYAKEILDRQLSSAKGKALNKEEVQTRFYAACNFLTTFLSLIDETKLRPNQR